MLNKIKVMVVVGLIFVGLNFVKVLSVKADTSYVGGGKVEVIYNHTENSLPDSTTKTWTKAKIKSKSPQTGVEIKNVEYLPVFSVATVILIILLLIYRKEKKKEF